MAHGSGHRRLCPECGQSVSHLADTLSHRELRGPRQITSSNIDRVFDDRGRLLFIEEKNDNERPISEGQKRLLCSLANLPSATVWTVRGTPQALTIGEIAPGGLGSLVCVGDFDDYQAEVAAWFEAYKKTVAS